MCRVTIAETSLSPNMVAKIPCEVHKANGLDGLVGVLEPTDKFRTWSDTQLEFFEQE